MKKYLFIIASVFMAASCTDHRRVITGETGPLEGSRIHIYEQGKYNNNVAVDSADITKGHFTLRLTDNVTDGLYFIGTAPDMGGVVFIDGRRMNIKALPDENGGIEWNVEGSPADKLYRDFTRRQYIVTERHARDSVDNLFYKARDIGDRDEMMRLKNESIEYYERGDKKEQDLVNDLVTANRNNPFGIYLYYTYIFRRMSFPTPESVEREREYISKFGPRAQSTSYYAHIEDALNRYDGCAIGAVAPEISGTDSLGNPLRLSDYRGNYVIVDFWTSYCHWCREETPYLLKAQEKFKDKNFRILGVSSDRDKERWLEAIREDGSYWDHMILTEGDKSLDTYCIKGIPHLILVGPDGKILAKGLRWDDHITVTEKFMNPTDT